MYICLSNWVKMLVNIVPKSRKDYSFFSLMTILYPRNNNENNIDELMEDCAAYLDRRMAMDDAA